MVKLIIFFLLTSIAAINPSWSANSDSIYKYYQIKNQAELAIVDSNYRQALALYRMAFQYNRPHEKDVYNAFILSCLLKDTVNTKTYFDTLTFLGLPAWSLMDDLCQGHIDTGIMKIILKDYKTVKEKSKASGFRRHAGFMDSLYIIDQGIRRLAMNSGDESAYRDSIINTDLVNLTRMVQYIKKNGFPDIYKTGFYAENYRHISSYPMLYLLIRHTLGVPSVQPDKAELIKLVKSAVIDGRYDARDYAFFYDENEETNKYGTVFKYTVYEGKQVFEPIDENEVAAINEARKAIYLESLDDYRKKLDFMQRSYWFHLFNPFTLLYNHIRYDPNSVKRK